MEVGTYHWEFDGDFQKKTTLLKVETRSNKDEEIVIRDLDIYPIQFADEDLVDRLRRRGQQVWNCRRGTFVSYTGSVPDVSGQGSGAERYIIDMKTHKRLHCKFTDQRDDLESVAFDNPDPPSDDFLLLL